MGVINHVEVRPWSRNQTDSRQMALEGGNILGISNINSTVKHAAERMKAMTSA